jgi:putative membrane protein insertion efficiency factor
VKRPALAAIRFYQRRLSPGRPPACRFLPTCSEYAYEAIETYGALRGGAMAVWRILRCNPLNDGGLDPVPERRNDIRDGEQSGHGHSRA